MNRPRSNAVSSRPKGFPVQPKGISTSHFVCGGHGARWPSHQQFTIKKGVTICFYIRDTESLDNSVGQQVDQVLAAGDPPDPVEVLVAGDRCWDYRLFSSKAGGYLNLKMSSMANENYISTTDKVNGISLQSIIEGIIKKSPFSVIHWSACRALEAENFTASSSNPEYDSSPALKKLSGK